MEVLVEDGKVCVDLMVKGKVIIFFCEGNRYGIFESGFFLLVILKYDIV